MLNKHAPNASAILSSFYLLSPFLFIAVLCPVLEIWKARHEKIRTNSIWWSQDLNSRHSTQFPF